MVLYLFVVIAFGYSVNWDVDVGQFNERVVVVDRLSDTAQNALINIVTIMLGLAVGSKLAADKFLNVETLGILGLGLAAFVIGTASGVLLAKLMNKLIKRKLIH